MKELFSIVVKEKASLIRGFIVVFMLALPLTFIPTVLRHGLSYYHMQSRIPDSILYTGLIALAIIIYALLNNYEKLQLKKYLFSLPAFTTLRFQGGIEGYNSIIKELSIFLIGKIGNYYYKLNISNLDKEYFRIEVAPLIQVEDNETAERLISELHLKESLFLCRIVMLTEEQLQEENVLRNELFILSNELTVLGITPLKITDDQLPKVNEYFS